MKQHYGRIPYMAVIRPPPPPATLHTFLLRHTVNTLLIKFEHNDSDQNGNSAGNMTLQERKNICSSTMDLSTGGTPSYHHPIACLQ